MSPAHRPDPELARETLWAFGLEFSTVSSWGLRNSIPEWRIGPVAELARRNDPPLAIPADFGPPIRREKAA